MPRNQTETLQVPQRPALEPLQLLPRRGRDTERGWKTQRKDAIKRHMALNIVAILANKLTGRLKKPVRRHGVSSKVGESWSTLNSFLYFDVLNQHFNFHLFMDQFE